MFDGFYHALEAIGYFHPVHPTQVNMPIGLVVGALVLGIVAFWSKNAWVDKAARYTYIVAFLFIFPTVAGAFMDWQHFYHGVWLFPIRIKVGLSCFFFIVLIAGILVGHKSQRITIPLLLIYLISMVTVVALGNYGADLVFGNRAPHVLQYTTGEYLFRGNCSGCHPYGGNILKPKIAVIGSDKLDSSRELTTWIRSPKPPMPAFSPQDISQEQTSALYQYLTFLWSSDQEGSGHEEGGGQGTEEQGEEHQTGP